MTKSSASPRSRRCCRQFATSCSPLSSSSTRFRTPRAHHRTPHHFILLALIVALSTLASRVFANRRVLSEAPPLYNGGEELQRIRDALQSAGYTEFLERINNPNILNIIRPALNHYRLTIFAVPNRPIQAAANASASPRSPCALPSRTPPGALSPTRSSADPMSESMSAHIILGRFSRQDIVRGDDQTKFGEMKRYRSNYVKRFQPTRRAGRRRSGALAADTLTLVNPVVHSRAVNVVAGDLLVDAQVSIQGVDGIMCTAPGRHIEGI